MLVDEPVPTPPPSPPDNSRVPSSRSVAPARQATSATFHGFATPPPLLSYMDTTATRMHALHTLFFCFDGAVVNLFALFSPPPPALFGLRAGAFFPTLSPFRFPSSFFRLPPSPPSPLSPFYLHGLLGSCVVRCRGGFLFFRLFPPRVASPLFLFCFFPCCFPAPPLPRFYPLCYVSHPRPLPPTQTRPLGGDPQSSVYSQYWCHNV